MASKRAYTELALTMELRLYATPGNEPTEEEIEDFIEDVQRYASRMRPTNTMVETDEEF